MEGCYKWTTELDRPISVTKCTLTSTARAMSRRRWGSTSRPRPSTTPLFRPRAQTPRFACPSLLSTKECVTEGSLRQRCFTKSGPTLKVAQMGAPSSAASRSEARPAASMRCEGLNQIQTTLWAEDTSGTLYALPATRHSTRMSPADGAVPSANERFGSCLRTLRVKHARSVVEKLQR